MKKLDIVGRRFGHLTAREEASNAEGRTQWRCTCDCGGEKIAKTGNLVTGKTTSCGCLKREAYAKFSKVNITHGKTKTTEFRIWSRMKERCYLKTHIAYDNYGGRGIKVCAKWRNDFEAFLRDVGPRPSMRHTLDRWPDNDGDYKPSNVRWATSKQQARNTSRTKVTSKVHPLIRRDGGTATQKEIAERYGVSQATVSRILSGESWS